MLKIYGTINCIDCVEAKAELNKLGIKYDFVELNDSILNLKEFLVLRDSKEEFQEMKKEGYVGVPCFILSEDKITFDLQEVIKYSTNL